MELRVPILAFDLPEIWNIVDLTLAIYCHAPVAAKPFVDALIACRRTLRACHIAALSRMQVSAFYDPEKSVWR